MLLLWLVNSTSSCSSTKYDPDLLRADIVDARNRVGRLKNELDRIRASMQYTEKGLETLRQLVGPLHCCCFFLLCFSALDDVHKPVFMLSFGDSSAVCTLTVPVQSLVKGGGR